MLLWAVIFGIFINEVYLYSTTHSLSIFETLETFGIMSQKSLLSFGIFAPLSFIILYTIRPLVFFPASIMTLSSVFIFGPYVGFLVSYIGETCSAVLTYTIGKYFGKEFGLTKKIEKTNIHVYLQKNGFLSIFILRIVPLFPFDFVNYSSGIFKISFKTYMAATLTGIVPGLIAFIFLGNSFLHPGQMPYAIAFVLILISIGWILKRRFQKTVVTSPSILTKKN